MKRKKLMFVSRSLSGGGAERVISNLANHFSKNNYDVTLVVLDKRKIVYPLASSLKVVELVERKAKENLIVRIYYAFLTFLRFLRIIRQEKPDCCISFMTSVNIWTGLCCTLLNVDYIVSERNSPFETLMKLNSLSKWIAFKVYNNAKAVVLPSKKMLETYFSLEKFNQLNNFRTIHNPVNTFNGKISSAAHPRNFILSVGRLKQHKGFETLIDAFYLLKNCDIDLLISGTGPYLETLERKVSELGLESRVKFIGFKNNIHDYYSQALLFASASRTEGYPNVLIEAMSLGCPSVATDCNFGPSEIIENGVNGFLVEVDNKEELAIAIEKLIEDETLRIKFSQNGKQLNQTNSLESIAEQWNNLILS